MKRKKKVLPSWMQDVYEQFQINKDDLLGSIAAFFAIALIAVAIGSVSNALSADNRYILVEMYCGLLGIACLFTVIISGLLFGAHFSWGIGMSRSRNEMILRLGSVVMGFHAILLVFSWVIYKLVVLCHEVAGQTGILGIAELGIPLWGWILILFLPLVGGAFAGGIVVRFGKKGGAILYVVFIAVCLAPSILLERGLFDHVDITIVIENSVMACLAVGLVVVIGWIDVVLLRGVKVR